MRRKNFLEVLKNGDLNDGSVTDRGSGVEIEEIDKTFGRTARIELLIESGQLERAGAFRLRELFIGVRLGFFGIGERIHGRILTLSSPDWKS